MAKFRFAVMLGGLLLLALGALGGALGAAASEQAAQGPDTLASLYRQVLKDPANSKLNLRYARLAEVEGKPRLALAAYERVILNDPNNREAQAGFARLRRQLEPSLTNFRLEAGAGYDDNPGSFHEDYVGEPIFFASFSMRDERSIHSMRWRTLGNLYGEYPLNIGELLYSYAGLQTGPLFDLTPRLTIHPAVGGAFSTLSKRLFYTEGNASVTLESRAWGGFQTVRVRGGYRSYGKGFAADAGTFADIVGRVTIPAVFGGRGALEISPWARWSGISGLAINEFNEEIVPGKYGEWGLSIGYYLKAARDLTLGIDISARQRLFLETRVADGRRREDNYIAPGFTVTRSNILACACDLLLDYHYRLNRSNDFESSYQGHRVSLSFASHF